MQFLQLSDFAARLNESFDVDIEGQQARFVLVEIAPLPFHPAPGLMRAPFSLMFRNEAAIVFPQRTYAMTNAVMGEFGIFLVPVARDVGGFFYQAIFN